jgi:hypothetical protein
MDPEHWRIYSTSFSAGSSFFKRILHSQQAQVFWREYFILSRLKFFGENTLFSAGSSCLERMPGTSFSAASSFWREYFILSRLKLFGENTGYFILSRLKFFEENTSDS